MIQTSLLCDNHLDRQENDYEAKLLAHGLIDSINKSNGHISIIISTKGLETLCRIGSAVIPVIPEPDGKEEGTDNTLITKDQAKEMLGVCDSTLWAWGKRHYLDPVKVGCRVKYRLMDVKRIMGA